MVAVDFNTTIKKTNTFLTGEWAWIFVDVPETFTQQFGNKQKGVKGGNEHVDHCKASVLASAKINA